MYRFLILLPITRQQDNGAAWSDVPPTRSRRNNAYDAGAVRVRVKEDSAAGRPAGQRAVRCTLYRSFQTPPARPTVVDTPMTPLLDKETDLGGTYEYSADSDFLVRLYCEPAPVGTMISGGNRTGPLKAHVTSGPPDPLYPSAGRILLLTRYYKTEQATAPHRKLKRDCHRRRTHR